MSSEIRSKGNKGAGIIAIKTYSPKMDGNYSIILEDLSKSCDYTVVVIRSRKKS